MILDHRHHWGKNRIPIMLHERSMKHISLGRRKLTQTSAHHSRDCSTAIANLLEPHHLRVIRVVWSGMIYSASPHAECSGDAARYRIDPCWSRVSHDHVKPITNGHSQRPASQGRRAKPYSTICQRRRTMRVRQHTQAAQACAWV